MIRQDRHSYENYQMIGSIQKRERVAVDETYLEGINLVTGGRIDYNRHLQTEGEIKSKCLDERVSRIDKFLYIMENGEKIQKWSVLENLPLSGDSIASSERAVALLQKNYEDYMDFIPIMGDGITQLIRSFPMKNISLFSKCGETIYRLLFRTLTSSKLQASGAVDEWIPVLKEFFQLACTNKDKKVDTTVMTKLNDLKAYINGSFAMNTLPERRKTAFAMIEVLMEVANHLTKLTHTKMLFFNNDLNPLARVLVCKILRKLLICHPQDCEAWKCVHEYYAHDKSEQVRECASELLMTIYCSANCELVFNELDGADLNQMGVLVHNLPSAVSTYHKQLLANNRLRAKLISFLNRLLRNNCPEYLDKALDSYCRLTDGFVGDQSECQLELKTVQMNTLKCQSKCIGFIPNIKMPLLKEHMIGQVKKLMKMENYSIDIDSKTLALALGFLDLTDDEDTTLLVSILTRAIDFSKWKITEVCLSRMHNAKGLVLLQNNYQKLCQLIVRLAMICPYFLLTLTFQLIVKLLLADRRNLELFIMLKEQLLAAKSWTLRRNYMLLYFEIKCTASFEFNRGVTMYAYKRIVGEKSPHFKLQFLRTISVAYFFIDPTLQSEKTLAREVISRLCEDNDQEVAAYAKTVQQQIRLKDYDTSALQQLFERDKQMAAEEQQVEQVLIESKRAIKTEKVINKKNSLDNIYTSLRLQKQGRKTELDNRVGSEKQVAKRSQDREKIKDISCSKNEISSQKALIGDSCKDKGLVRCISSQKRVIKPTLPLIRKRL